MADFNMDNVYSGAEYDGPNDENIDLDDWSGMDVKPADDASDSQEAEAYGGAMFDDGMNDTDEEIEGSAERNDQSEASNSEQATEVGGDMKPPLGAGAKESSANVFSSLANALTAEGVFNFLQDPTQVKDAESFREAMEQEVYGRLSNEQKRISMALNAGAPVDEISQLEGLTQELSGYSDQDIEDESDKGLELRKSLIYKSALMQGLSESKAQKEVEKSIKAGTDIEDAKDGLNEMRSNVKATYENMVKSAEADKRRRYDEFVNYHKQVKADIDGQPGFLGDLTPQMKRRVYESAFVPTETMRDGTKMTKIERFSYEHPEVFSRMMGEMYVLTNGFQNMDKLGGAKVRKGVTRGLAELERSLKSNPTSLGSGSLKYASEDSGDIYSNGRYVLEV